MAKWGFDKKTEKIIYILPQQKSQKKRFKTKIYYLPPPMCKELHARRRDQTSERGIGVKGKPKVASCAVIVI